MVNGKTVVAYFSILFQHSPGDTGEERENKLTLACNPAKIRNKYLQNVSSERNKVISDM
jgi:hypothetical protein